MTTDLSKNGLSTSGSFKVVDITTDSYPTKLK